MRNRIKIWTFGSVLDYVTYLCKICFITLQIFWHKYWREDDNVSAINFGSMWHWMDDGRCLRKKYFILICLIKCKSYPSITLWHGTVIPRLKAISFYYYSLPSSDKYNLRIQWGITVKQSGVLSVLINYGRHC